MSQNIQFQIDFLNLSQHTRRYKCQKSWTLSPKDVSITPYPLNVALASTEQWRLASTFASFSIPDESPSPRGSREWYHCLFPAWKDGPPRPHHPLRPCSNRTRGQSTGDNPSRPGLPAAGKPLFRNHNSRTRSGRRANYPLLPMLIEEEKTMNL